jgi:hypothetical protein
MATLSSVIPPVNISSASGTLPVASGGTGLTSPGTAGNVLSSNGTTWESVTPPPSGPTLQAIASGVLSNGIKVVVNSDGTVSAVQPTGGAPFVGPEFVFNSAATNSAIASVYDPVSQKVIIAYTNGGNSSYGTVRVGTVSGTTITFGTAVVFTGTSILSRASMVYDTVNQKVVITYLIFTSPGNSLFAIVGTVSGTSISFGTPYGTGVSASQGITSLSAAYDTNAQKVVVVYTFNNSVVTSGRAIVGTVSGTNISFGSEVIFKNTSTSSIAAAYDASAQKVVVAYTDGANSGFGTATVGTVSGTTISFGTPTVYISSSTQFTFVCYDPVQQKNVIVYGNNANSSNGWASVGTVSGTAISFGSAVQFSSVPASVPQAVYDTNLQKIVIAYSSSSVGYGVVGTVSGSNITFGPPTVFNSGSSTSGVVASYAANIQNTVVSFNDGGNSNFGTSLVFQTSGTNLTTTNYIGISNAAYTNGQTATIQVAGAVDDAQSGLTPGILYYVRTDGTLASTAGFPSVIAGTAVGATKIIVKG